MAAAKGLPPVVFEDEHLIAFDKPSGLLVAPDRWDKTRENLMDQIHQRLSPDCFNAHRLDRDTSGIILCARKKEILRPLVRLFESRAMAKEYVAVVSGGPADDRGTIALALAEDPLHPGRMITNSNGKHSETEYEVVERWRRFAFVRLHPLTGRTHQLRVHMAAVGCPILCDPIYGGNRKLFLSRIKPGYKFKRDRDELPMIRRLALHAAGLRFQHPVTGAEVDIRSPMPHEFEVGMKYLRRYAPLVPPPPADSL